jgi:signal transduction histidine kinase
MGRPPYATLDDVADPEDPSAPKAYARLLSLAVHEFRTPASVVGGYLRMLQRDADPPLSERQRKMVEEAERSCARLVALVAELSEISKIDGETAAFKDESFDLFRAVAEVANSVHEAEDREVRLVVRGDADGAPIHADLARLQAAFASFIRAILREQPASCTVVAECIRVTGSGAASAVVVVGEESIVQRAYEAPRAPFDEKRGGLGLTLPIARRVIERHGGGVWSPAAAPDEAWARRAVIITLPMSETRR